MRVDFYAQQLNQDFLLLFGAEKASRMLEKWDTVFKPKVIKEAKHVTQTPELCRLFKAAEKLTEDDDNGKYMTCLLSTSVTFFLLFDFL